MKAVPIATLGIVVLANYASQVPYYFHQYYPAPPSWPGTVLLALTLVWFSVGFLRFVLALNFGFSLLVVFLAAQILFYGHSVLLSLVTGSHGGMVAQLSNPSPFLLIIFSIGYLNFVVAVWALAWLVIFRRRAAHA